MTKERDALVVLAEKIDELASRKDRTNWPAWIAVGISLAHAIGMGAVLWDRQARLKEDHARLEADQDADRAAAATGMRRLTGELNGHRLGCDGLHPRVGACAPFMGADN